MKQNRTIEVNELLDWYGCLLTEKADANLSRVLF